MSWAPPIQERQSIVTQVVRQDLGGASCSGCARQEQDFVHHTREPTGLTIRDSRSYGQPQSSQPVSLTCVGTGGGWAVRATVNRQMMITLARARPPSEVSYDPPAARKVAAKAIEEAATTQEPLQQT